MNGHVVNVNIEVPDDIHKQAKLAAVMRGITLKEHIIERLEAGLREVHK